VTDRDGYFTYVNKSMAKAFGYSKEEMIGMHLMGLLPKDILRKGFQQNFDELRNKGELILERTWITKDGKNMIGDVRAIAFYDSEGRFMGSRGVFRDTTERKKTEKALRKRDDELALKNKTLGELNAALHVLLKKREDDKTELEKKVALNIRSLIMPYLDALRNSRLDLRQQLFVDILESNLNDIISPFLYILSSMQLRFTPTEVKVCNLIKQGKTTKEIAGLMSLSPKTIETHRKKIREKIGIKNKKENLATHLMEFYTR
jgi:PAS domain S-box-containing protein